MNNTTDDGSKIAMQAEFISYLSLLDGIKLTLNILSHDIWDHTGPTITRPIIHWARLKVPRDLVNHDAKSEGDTDHPSTSKWHVCQSR